MTRTSRAALAGVLAATTIVVAPTITAVPAVAAAAPHDGATQATAAASCWEIKQEVPAAKDGTYWLLTAGLDAPTQVHCDMTTDGGGWVLVGRGRDGWRWDGDAQGSPAQVAGTVDGPDAFSPRKLSSATIDGLLGGGRVDALTDGIRLRRATSETGSSWQEVRFSPRSADGWTWAFGGGMPLARVTIDGTSYPGATTRDFGTTSTSGTSAYRRVWTYESSSNGWVRGFNHGSAVRGGRGDANYLYAVKDGYASPFTQVYVRPRLRTDDQQLAPVPAAGTKAVTAVPVARSGALEQPWGVAGTGRGGTGELGTEVQAFAQVGDVMYVGGNFTTVRNQDGTQSVAQPYLAAFDAATGRWISSFRPTFDHQVRSLAALPDGRLAVGGEFATVDGQPHRGLVVLDLARGAPDPRWTTQLENRIGSGAVSVRALDVSRGYLYLGGAFTHVVKGTTTWFNRNAGRIRVSDGVGSTWNPDFDGAVADLDVDASGDRVYVAGYMTRSGDVAVRKGAAVRTDAAATVVPWSPLYSTTTPATYQQAVRQVKQKVWLGGAQHSMFGYDRSTLELETTHLTRSGGDLQAMADNGALVYGGCHCGDWTFTGARSYDTGGLGSTSVDWSRVDKISLLGAWDASTGRYVDTFAPQWKSRGGYGVWAVQVAADGTLWAGGSIESVVKEDGANQWAGGFARFAQRPATAPAPPSGATATVEAGTATVSWSPSATKGVTYEVFRGNRAVATTTSTSVRVPGAKASDRYVVRAGDGNGNWSRSTPKVAPRVTTTLVPAGSTWRYWDAEAAVAPRWRYASFDDAAWPTGAAPLGWGDDALATRFAPGRRPLATYYRSTFRVGSVEAWSTYTLTTRADDGVVVYVNGREVARAHMPSGAVDGDTYATAAPATRTALADPVVVRIPAGYLRDGRNVVTAEVHSNYTSTPSHTFDAAVVAAR